MNIMPCILYHFQALPIRIPGSFLRLVRCAPIHFLWAQRPPRLAQSVLRLPKLMGGIVLPDANLYLVACHLTKVLDWCHHGSLKQWVQIEQALVGIPMESVLWCHPNLAIQVHSESTVGETWQHFRDLAIALKPIHTYPYSGEHGLQPWPAQSWLSRFEGCWVVSGTALCD